MDEKQIELQFSQPLQDALDKMSLGGEPSGTSPEIGEQAKSDPADFPDGDTQPSVSWNAAPPPAAGNLSGQPMQGDPTPINAARSYSPQSNPSQGMPPRSNPPLGYPSQGYSPQRQSQPAQYNSTPQFGGPPPRAPQPPVYREPTIPAPMPQQVYAAPVKQRRVGTFTLGLTLVMLGILIPCALVIGPQVWNWMRLAPAVLVLLGLETLVYSIRFRSEKLRYDGLSVFMVILITFSTLGASAIVPPLGNVLEYRRQEQELQNSVDSIGRKVLTKLGYQGRVSAYTMNDNWEFFFDGQTGGFTGDICAVADLDGINIDRPTKEQVAQAYLQLGKELLPETQAYRLHINFDTLAPDENVGGEANYSIELYKDELDLLTEDFVLQRLDAEYEALEFYDEY